MGKKLPTLNDVKVPKGGLLNKGLRVPPTIKHLNTSNTTAKLKSSNFKNVL